jgi:hypothetical protein
MSSCCGWRIWPPDMEGSCEYIKQSLVIDKSGPLAWGLSEGMLQRALDLDSLEQPRPIKNEPEI